MPQLSPEVKHHILQHYSSRDPARSFVSLARLHNIAGGERTLRRWHQQWDGTVQSLQRKQGSGRPRTLSRAEVNRHVRTPIRSANRAHRAISYTTLLPDVQLKTGKNVTLRTLQRYGKEELKANQKHTKKRTADESKCTDTTEKR